MLQTVRGVTDPTDYILLIAEFTYTDFFYDLWDLMNFKS